MNARPEFSTVRAIDDCLVDGPLLDPAAARKIILGDVSEIVGDESASMVRLLPLVHADGLAELGPDPGNVDEGPHVRFHPFSNSFAI